ncbi:MAG: hypothetical protein ABSD92_01935 [Candidatus Bathyarchaeia archaeon]
MSEYVCPRCIRKLKIRSMSGRTDAASRSGRFTLTLASLNELFPSRILRQSD